MIDLNTQRLVLKLPQGEDKIALVEHLNNFDVAKWLSRVPYPYSLSDAQEWIELVNKKINDEKASLGLSIFMNEALIGGVGLSHVEKDIYELGYWLARDYWGNGITLEAATELLRYGQANLRDPKIVAHCMKGNAASASVLKKLGFEVTAEVDIYSVARNASMPSEKLSLL